MFAYIKGKITLKTPTFVHLETNGVAYFINISLHTFSRIGNSMEAKLYIYTHVREDAFSLYGFFDQDEKLLFEKLISVSGIGTNTAQVILSTLSPKDIFGAIVNEDDAILKSVKGIGAKTAKRVILDLKDKVSKLDIKDTPTTTVPKQSPVKDEALAALMALGVNKAKAEAAVNKVLKADDGQFTVESVIKEALKLM